ncbi:phosphoglycerate mutase family protein [Alkalisalibacterium limincola]|uniref:Histidine phosphatase family protein n=1 Tax=Alkalisalibacterium limincola TaxID=2699169 RepID=A0A5C8KMJ0_9GAMM|nr:phosphoglycerate mutase family protein [Alkalisalibacterium limincola]TXK60981.1 histidine phosphatase family protein [Alkalisalibacterium limincola]
MKTNPRFFLPMISALALMLALAPMPPAHAADTLVVLVRHAEKLDEPGPDPALSEAGERRARALVGRLEHAGIDTIYVTSLQRTALTAKPLAAHLGLEPRVFWPNEEGHGAAARALADRIRRQHSGGSVLVVGHSNTLPMIVEALTGVVREEIDEGDYENLFVIVVDAEGGTRLLPARQ